MTGYHAPNALPMHNDASPGEAIDEIPSYCQPVRLDDGGVGGASAAGVSSVARERERERERDRETEKERQRERQRERKKTHTDRKCTHKHKKQ
jgi:hypothetical protein